MLPADIAIGACRRSLLHRAAGRGAGAPPPPPSGAGGWTRRRSSCRSDAAGHHATKLTAAQRGDATAAVVPMRSVELASARHLEGGVPGVDADRLRRQRWWHAVQRSAETIWRCGRSLQQMAVALGQRGRERAPRWQPASGWAATPGIAVGACCWPGWTLACEQPACVGVLRRPHDLARPARARRCAAVHHGDVVGDRRATARSWVTMITLMPLVLDLAQQRRAPAPEP